MSITRRNIGGLNCTIVDDLPDGSTPDVLCILSHGYGASGEDLVDIGSQILAVVPELQSIARFVFPEAPLSLAELGYGDSSRAWWHLDMEKITAAIARGELRDQRNDLPAELPAAREAMLELIRVASEEADLPPSKIVLGGFSQGSILSIDLALRLPETIGALVVWSGTLLCEQEWRSLAANHPQLRVLQTHGETDTLLPFVAAEWLRDMFFDCKINVDFLSFPGQHSIPQEGFIGLVKVLHEVATA